MFKSLYCIRNAHNNGKVLTNIGKTQVNLLKSNWRNMKDIELIITDNSPKSIKTTNQIFDNVPIIPLNLHNEEIDYDRKLNMFFNTLKDRQECMIAYVGHSKFINTVKCADLYYKPFKKHVKRAHPYLVELTFKRDFCDN